MNAKLTLIDIVYTEPKTFFTCILLLIGAPYSRKIRSMLIFWFIIKSKKLKLFWLHKENGGCDVETSFKKAKYNVP